MILNEVIVNRREGEEIWRENCKRAPHSHLLAFASFKCDSSFGLDWLEQKCTRWLVYTLDISPAKQMAWFWTFRPYIFCAQWEKQISTALDLMVDERVINQYVWCSIQLETLQWIPLKRWAVSHHDFFISGLIWGLKVSGVANSVAAIASQNLIPFLELWQIVDLQLSNALKVNKQTKKYDGLRQLIQQCQSWHATGGSSWG